MPVDELIWLEGVEFPGTLDEGGCPVVCVFVVDEVGCVAAGTLAFDAEDDCPDVDPDVLDWEDDCPDAGPDGLVEEVNCADTDVALLDEDVACPDVLTAGLEDGGDDVWGVVIPDVVEVAAAEVAGGLDIAELVTRSDHRCRNSMQSTNRQAIREVDDKAII